MLENEVATAFAREPGKVPRATVLCYALAVLHAAVAVSWGIYEDSAETVAMGIIAATALLGLWVAIGTALALLARVSDRPQVLPRPPGDVLYQLPPGAEPFNLPVPPPNGPHVIPLP